MWFCKASERNDEYNDVCGYNKFNVTPSKQASVRESWNERGNSNFNARLKYNNNNISSERELHFWIISWLEPSRKRNQRWSNIYMNCDNLLFSERTICSKSIKASKWPFLPLLGFLRRGWSFNRRRRWAHHLRRRVAKISSAASGFGFDQLQCCRLQEDLLSQTQIDIDSSRT